MSSTLTIERSAVSQIAQNLSQLLADTYILYIKTQNFHWNVVDPRFYSLHKFFEGQYEELEEAIDTIAERIRALGVRSPGSMREFLEIGTLTEAEGDLTGDQMIHQLVDDNEKIANFIRPHIQAFQKAGDEGSADLLIERLRAHEKTAWMLRSNFGHHLPSKGGAR
jgi:starvation-inducible DNA-binding protein